ncbi:cupin-like domain-containing protein [Ningiella sp. W23]|uniref:cupin-like domain-containing protein n=1 Tax=Ningiella sp. W23 TaxID=3023715 RepID=UPI003757CC5E
MATQSVPDSQTLSVAHICSDKPLLIEGLVAQWPAVRKAQTSNNAFVDYINQFYNERPTNIYRAPPEAKGRLAYTEDGSALNFKVSPQRLDAFLDEILQGIGIEGAPTLYNSSSVLDTFYPGFNQDNPLDIPFQEAYGKQLHPIISIWMGNKTTASCHYDVLDNVACCVAGSRRFTLFPPEQVDNLYPGPLYPTPGGQVISMVDFENPDFEKHPRFKEALKHGLVFDLKPGDAIFIPALWWHHVQGLADFNALVNFWWNEAPAYLGRGMDSLEHAMLAIRDLPAAQKAAWKHMFDYYVFGDSEAVHSHLADKAKGFLAPLDENAARQLKAMLQNKLNR